MNYCSVDMRSVEENVDGPLTVKFTGRDPDKVFTAVYDPSARDEWKLVE